MKKAKLQIPGSIVNGTLGGHPFLNKANHASKGAVVVSMPLKQGNISQIEGRKLKATRPAIMSANAKGAV